MADATCAAFCPEHWPHRHMSVPEFACVHLETSIAFHSQNHSVELCQIADLASAIAPGRHAKCNDEMRVLQSAGQ